MGGGIEKKLAYIKHPEAVYAEAVRRHIDLYPGCNCSTQLTYKFTRVSLGDLAPDCNLCGVGLEWGDGRYYDGLDESPSEVLEVFNFSRVRYEELGSLKRNSLCGCCFGRVREELLEVLR